MEVSPEMQQRIISTRAELQSVRARQAAADQQKKVLDLTSRQIKQEKVDDKLWQGVGRMFVKVSKDDFEKDVEAKNKQIEEEKSALEKKELYYSTTLSKMVDAVKLGRE